MFFVVIGLDFKGSRGVFWDHIVLYGPFYTKIMVSMNS